MAFSLGDLTVRDLNIRLQNNVEVAAEFGNKK
jgi:hypothetical protein